MLMSQDTSVMDGLAMLRVQGPVTQRWSQAWEKFFRHLYPKVVAAVCRRVGPRHGEEAAQKAFEIAMEKAAEKGLPAWVVDRVTLLRYLACVAFRHALNLLRDEERAVLVTVLASHAGEGDLADWADASVGPDDLALARLEAQRLLALLPDGLRQIVAWRLDGMRNAEIADRMGVVETTVERKFQRVREIWRREGKV
jgi:DNA-directed RNA polymerase specialized sigma24 family protein